MISNIYDVYFPIITSLIIRSVKTAKTSILYKNKMAKAAKAAKDLLKVKLVLLLIWQLYLNIDT